MDNTNTTVQMVPGTTLDESNTVAGAQNTQTTTHTTGAECNAITTTDVVSRYAPCTNILVYLLLAILRIYSIWVVSAIILDGGSSVDLFLVVFVLIVE